MLDRPPTGYWLIYLMALALPAQRLSAGQPEPLNVLFIAVDDLRPELGCYGHPVVQTPNIDRLAADGTLFTHAYCQQAVCNPSRVSLMTGLRPETTGIMDLPTHFRDVRPEAVTIAQHFKQHGYFTQRVGKIFHTGHGNRDDTLSWSIPARIKLAPRYGPEATQQLRELMGQAKAQGVDVTSNKTRPRGLPWEAPEVADNELTDGSIAENAIKLLREHQDQPFFLAVGFLNPHLPFVAPRKYWNLYDRDAIELPDNSTPPAHSPSYAWTSWGEMRKYHGIPAKGPLTDAQARTAIHGYWAATSYVDAMVGQLLDELKRLELRQETIVILWGDHGWQLGEHGFWCKHTNYEVAARVPLVISIPGQIQRGSHCHRLVEFVDIFPTLADACGLPTPAGLDGISFVPLVENPQLRWKQAAFHLYPRSIPQHGPGVGYAIRTDRYRLVKWSATKSSFHEYELYDLHTDPEENTNLAHLPESQRLVQQLSNQLEAGWRKALPK